MKQYYNDKVCCMGTEKRFYPKGFHSKFISVFRRHSMYYPNGKKHSF